MVRHGTYDVRRESTAVSRANTDDVRREKSIRNDHERSNAIHRRVDDSHRVAVCALRSMPMARGERQREESLSDDGEA